MKRRKLTVNPILNQYRGSFEQLLNETEFKHLLIQNGIISSNNDENVNDLLNNHILVCKLIDILDVLRKIPSSGCQTLYLQIKLAWKNFITEMKKSTLRRIINLPKIPFLNEKINLNSINSIMTPIKILFQGNKPIRNDDMLINGNEFMNTLQDSSRIFIYGEAGIGKTFHSYKILYDWANNLICPDSLLLSVNLGQISKTDTFSEVIFNQNFIENENVEKDIFNYYLSDECEDKNRSLVFLLDGADELGIRDSKFYRIIHWAKVISHPIIVWSRSYKLEEVRKTYDTLLEIIGFSNDQKLKFFQKFFDESDINEEENFGEDSVDNFIDDSFFSEEQQNRCKSTELIKFLKTKRQDLYEFCHYPLIAVLTAAVWERKGNLMKDFYNIFEDVVEILFQKVDISKENPHFEQIQLDFGKKSFENLSDGEPMTTTREIFSLTKNLAGLITKFNNTHFLLKQEIPFRFIHRLFQEYFAAKYLINEFNLHKEFETKEKFFEKFSDNKKIIRLKRVFDFIQNSNLHIYKEIIEKNTKILDILKIVDTNIVNLLEDSLTKRILHFKEFHLSKFVLQLFIDNFGKNSNLKELIMENIVFDLDYFFRKLCNSSIKTLTHLKIINRINGFLMSTDNFQLVFSSLVKLDNLYLENISIEGNVRELLFATKIFNLHFVKMVLPLNYSMKTFENIRMLDFSHSTQIGDQLLRDFLDLKYLTSLLLCYTFCLNSSNISIIFDILRKKNDITEIGLSGFSFTQDSQRIFFEILTDYTRKITVLKLNDCTIIITSANNNYNSFFSFLKNNYNLKVLELENNSFEGCLLINFLSSISVLNKLKTLKLPNFGLNDENSTQMDIQFQMKFSLFNLNFGKNNLNYLINQQLLKILLKTSVYLKELDLSNCNIDNVNYSCLNDIFPEKYENLLKLNVSGNFSLDITFYKFLLETNFLSRNFENSSHQLIFTNNNGIINSEIFFILLKISIFHTINFSKMNFSLNNKNIKQIENFSNSYLSKIIISNCKLQSIFLEIFSKYIDKLIALQYLDISNNYFNNSAILELIRKIIDSQIGLNQLYFYKQNMTKDVILDIVLLLMNRKELFILNSGKDIREFNLTEMMTNEFANSQQFNLHSVELIENFFKQEINYQLLELDTKIRKEKMNILKVTSGIEIKNLTIKNKCLQKISLIDLKHFLHGFSHLTHFKIDTITNSDFSLFLSNFLSLQHSLVYISIGTLDQSWTNYTYGFLPDAFQTDLFTPKEIIINNCHITKDLGKSLGKFLEKQEKLLKLVLQRGNLIGDIGRNIFENCCSSLCCKIEEINFGLCSFCPEMSIRLGNFIGSQINLKKLSLHQTNLSGEIGQNIFENISPSTCRIEELNLESCYFSIEMSIPFGKFIGNQKNLKKLNLISTYLQLDIGKNIFENISDSCCNLEELLLDYCSLSADMSNPLGKFIGNQNNLRKLSLNNTNLKDDIGNNIFGNIFQYCSSLEELHLGSCHFTQEMSPFLGKAINVQEKLKILNLQDTNIIDDSGNNIFENNHDCCCNIEELSLKNCRLSEKMSKSLGKFIRKQKNLIKLDLSFTNLIDNIGKNIFQSSDISCCRIEELNLSCCDLSIEMSTFLGEFIGLQIHLRKLSFHKKDMNSEIGQKIFKNINHKCCNVEFLKLVAFPLSPNTSTELGRFLGRQRSLRHLNLSSTDLREKNGKNIFENISNSCCNFQVLYFNSCKFSNDMSIPLRNFLCNQKNLKKLYLNDVELTGIIGANIFKDISTTCSTIEELHFDSSIFSVEMSIPFAKFIGQQHNLKQLNFFKIDLTGETGNNIFKTLAESCTSILDLNLGSCIFSSDMGSSLGDFLAKQTNLKYLNLFDTNISHKIGKNIFKNSISTCCNIEDLNLDTCIFSDDMSVELGKFIGFQTNLRKLNFYDTNVSCEIGKNIFQNIPKTCCNLEELKMKSFNFSPKMSISLGKFIGYQTNLRHLNLNDTDLKGEIGNNLFVNISNSCTSIEKLQFDDCSFSIEMSISLGNFIGNQTNVKHLSLSNIDFRHEIGKNVFKSIPKSCCNIEELYFDSCTFSIEMSDILGDFINCQTNLRELNMGKAKMDDEVGKAIFEKVTETCSNIEELELDSLNLTIYMTIPVGIFIGHQRKLRKLNLFSTNLRGKIGENLFKNIPKCCFNIEELNLGCCIFSVEMSAELGRFIGNQTILSDLNISQTDIRNELGRKLFTNISSNCCNIYNLNAENCKFSVEMSIPFGKFVGNQVNLSKLNLYSTNFSEEICKNVFENIPEPCCNIEELNASSHEFSLETNSEFNKFLRQQINLKKCNLR